MDCYAHCEGSGCWDLETLYMFDVAYGLCHCWQSRYGNWFEKIDFIPSPEKTEGLYWFHPPHWMQIKRERREAIKVRIDYMQKHLK